MALVGPGVCDPPRGVGAAPLDAAALEAVPTLVALVGPEIRDPPLNAAAPPPDAAPLEDEGLPRGVAPDLALVLEFDLPLPPWVPLALFDCGPKLVLLG